jgi:hypothetical protein
MFKKNTNNTGMKLVIDAATAELLKETPGSERYDKIVAQLERLNKIAASNSGDKVSKDGLVAVAANLLGIGLIIKHEQFNVITSKALGFVGKFR